MFVDKNPTIVAVLPALVTGIVNLKGLRSDIKAALLVQLGIITGIAYDKKVARALLVKLTAKTARQISSYAHTIGDHDLESSMNYNKSKLEHMSGQNLKVAAQLVLDSGTLHTADLADYGIDAASLHELKDAKTDFEEKMGEPKVARAARKTCTAQLKILFPQVMDLLRNEIDKLVASLPDGNEQFQDDYKNVRNIYDRKGARIKPATTPGNGTITSVVTNSVDSSFIEDTTAIIVELNKSAVSDEEGVIYFEDVAPGVYTIKFSAETYVSKTISGVEVLADANTDQDVALDSDESDNSSDDNQPTQE